MEPTGWSWTHWIEEQICAHNVSRERWNESQEWSEYEVIISYIVSIYYWCFPCFFFFRNFLFLKCGMSKGKGNQIWRDMFWPMESGDESPRNRLLKTDDVISLHDQKLGKQLWLCPIQTLKFSRLWLWSFPDLFLLWLFPEGFCSSPFSTPGQQSVSPLNCFLSMLPCTNSIRCCKYFSISGFSVLDQDEPVGTVRRCSNLEVDDQKPCFLMCYFLLR